jgi:hypothetical protein
LDAISKSPSDGFEERLFCRKSKGKTFRRAGPALTPGDLFLCKDPTQKKISPAGHQTPDPVNVHNINTRSDNHLQAEISNVKVQSSNPWQMTKFKIPNFIRDHMEDESYYLKFGFHLSFGF